MENELIVEMFEHVEFAGQHHYLYKDKSSFSKESFKDMVLSIIVDAGPSWDDYVVNFYERDGYGGGLLQPGSFRPGTKIPDSTANPYVFNAKFLY